MDLEPNTISISLVAYQTTRGYTSPERQDSHDGNTAVSYRCAPSERAMNGSNDQSFSVAGFVPSSPIQCSISGPLKLTRADASVSLVQVHVGSYPISRSDSITGDSPCMMEINHQDNRVLFIVGCHWNNHAGTVRYRCLRGSGEYARVKGDLHGLGASMSPWITTQGEGDRRSPVS